MSDNPLHAVSMLLFNKLAAAVEPKVAIDAGANTGGYTQILLNAGIQRVYAFEPVPVVFDGLAHRFKDEPRVYCEKVGLSDYPGSLENVTVCVAWTIGDPDKLGMSVCPGFVDKPTFSVKLTTIDAYMSGVPLGFMKVDVDGYEHKVLHGAKDTISKYRPPIFCEFSGYIDKVSGSSEAFVRFILHLGYVVVSADGRNIFTSWEAIKPYYPFNSSFDVMLLPKERSQELLA